MIRLRSCHSGMAVNVVLPLCNVVRTHRLGRMREASRESGLAYSVMRNRRLPGRVVLG